MEERGAVFYLKHEDLDHYVKVVIEEGPPRFGAAFVVDCEEGFSLERPVFRFDGLDRDRFVELLEAFCYRGWLFLIENFSGHFHHRSAENARRHFDRGLPSPVLLYRVVIAPGEGGRLMYEGGLLNYLLLHGHIRR